MTPSLVTLIAGIVFEGLKTWNVERRSSFMRKHGKVLKTLNDAKNAHFPDYSDASVNLAEEELETFLAAYLQGKKEINESSNSNKSNPS